MCGVQGLRTCHVCVQHVLPAVPFLHSGLCSAVSCSDTPSPTTLLRQHHCPRVPSLSLSVRVCPQTFVSVSPDSSPGGPHNTPAESVSLSQGRRTPWSAGPRGGSRPLPAVGSKGAAPSQPITRLPGLLSLTGCRAIRGVWWAQGAPTPQVSLCSCPAWTPRAAVGQGPCWTWWAAHPRSPPLTPQEKGAREALSAVTALSLARLVPKCNLEYLKELSECPTF